MLEFFLDRRIAAIDMIDALDIGAAVGHQRGKHQARRSAQIRRHHGRRGQAFDALDDGGVALQADFRAHAPHFQHVHEAVLKNRFDDGADAVRHGVERRELRLHVGGESRIRCRANIDGRRPFPSHVDFDPRVAHLNTGAGLLELVDDGIHVLRARIFYTNVAAGDGARHQIRARFNSIRQNFIGRSAQALHALDDDSVGARTLDLGAHGNQEIRKINHLGLARGVLQDRLALGQGRCHHEIFRAGDRDRLEHQARAF